ncbi:C40 family peptidase [Thioalkalivibrio sulfidiphilus]|uniref:C40 family peptidase n=1 Tax=Thioalkalivibrio sulfidiphilus TaxID=1033854 RepID=UPI0003631000|nr:C40 family peptidase [Thioalkalivibrio sulfidiphilus]
MAPPVLKRLTGVGRLAAALLLASLLGACASTAPQRPVASLPPVLPDQTSLHPARVQVINTALAQLGTPYRFGGDTPRGFDCSGLVQYAHQAARIPVPRQTGDQAAHARPVPAQARQPGDLLFFRINDNKPSHVSIYLGNGQFVHAPSSGGHVSIERLDNPYWAPRLLHVGHYFPD